jgi:sulfur-oxidizing protein SoxB
MLPFAALGQNIFDAEWDEPAEMFEPYQMFERGGTKIAVIGQAFPYMPIANPRWMFPEYSFGIRDERMQEMVDEVRGAGRRMVVVLSHNGFDVDKKMASVVPGIDVILSGHTHDALPEPVLVGDTILVASGSNGKFVSRVDLDVRDGRMMGYPHKLIPIFSDVIAPDAEMAALIDAERAPFEAELEEVIGRPTALLYRRGNFNGTWDDLICDALIEERDAEIALSPGVRWGPSLMPRAGHHPRGHLERHLDDLPQGLPHRDDRRIPQGRPRGRGRQHLQPRPLLPAGRRHGAHRRHGLPHRRQPSRRASGSPT